MIFGFDEKCNFMILMGKSDFFGFAEKFSFSDFGGNIFSD